MDMSNSYNHIVVNKLTLEVSCALFFLFLSQKRKHSGVVLDITNFKDGVGREKHLK